MQFIPVPAAQFWYAPCDWIAQMWLAPFFNMHYNEALIKPWWEGALQPGTWSGLPSKCSCSSNAVGYIRQAGGGGHCLMAKRHCTSASSVKNFNSNFTTEKRTFFLPSQLNQTRDEDQASIKRVTAGDVTLKDLGDPAHLNPVQKKWEKRCYLNPNGYARTPQWCHELQREYRLNGRLTRPRLRRHLNPRFCKKASTTALALAVIPGAWVSSNGHPQDANWIYMASKSRSVPSQP